MYPVCVRSPPHVSVERSYMPASFAGKKIEIRQKSKHSESVLKPYTPSAWRLASPSTGMGPDSQSSV